MPTRGISPTRLVRTSVLAVSVLVSPGSPGDHDQDTDEHPTEEDGYRAAQPRHRVSEFRDAEHDAADRSYRLACVGGNWQFVTKPDFAPWLQVLVGAKPRPPKLSHPALETLAIIAYRQPITRAEIEQIRGVAVDGVVQTLVERELIEVCGEADAPGRPRLYGTTQFFLEHFGLKGLDELPAADELRRIHIELATAPGDDSQEQLPLDNETDEADDDPDEDDDDENDDDK